MKNENMNFKQRGEPSLGYYNQRFIMLKKNKKAQVSMEFLLIFAISLVVFLFISLIVYEQLDVIEIRTEEAEMQRTMTELSTAIKEVYTQGEGASKNFILTLPETYKPNKSNISNNTVFIKIRKTVWVESFPFSVYGKLPNSSGYNEILLVSRGNSVYVGKSLFRMSPSLVSFVLLQNSNKTEYITITNLVNETISVNTLVSWPHTKVNLLLSNSSFNLPAYAQTNISVYFNSSQNSTGTYTGSIAFNVNTTQDTDNQTLSIYVEVPS